MNPEKPAPAGTKPSPPPHKKVASTAKVVKKSTTNAGPPAKPHSNTVAHTFSVSGKVGRHERILLDRRKSVHASNAERLSNPDVVDEDGRQVPTGKSPKTFGQNPSGKLSVGHEHHGRWSTHFKFFEIEFAMDPAFEGENSSEALKEFACKALLLFSFQLLLLALFMIAQISSLFPTSAITVYVFLSLYILLYLLIRSCKCANKYPENLLLFFFMTFFMLPSFGNFPYGSFRYTSIIYTIAIVCAFLNIVIYAWSTKMNMLGCGLYFGSISYFILFTVAMTISACLFLDKPGQSFDQTIDLRQMGMYFPAFLLFLIIMIFELQRLIRGRRIPLLKDEWATACLVLPFSLLYPAYLIRTLKCCRSPRVSFTLGTGSEGQELQDEPAIIMDGGNNNVVGIGVDPSPV